MIGGCVAVIVPSSGIVTLGLRQQLEQERLEVVVGAVDLVDQQHGGPRAGMLERPQQRSPDQVVRAEQLLLAQRGVAGVGEPDAEQLPRVVPLVERLRRVDPLVALQPDQRRVEHGRERLGRLGLAHARLALEQQRLRQAQAEEHRRGQALVHEVVHGRRGAGPASRRRARGGGPPGRLPVTSGGLMRRSGRRARPGSPRGCPRPEGPGPRSAPSATSAARWSSRRHTPLSPCRSASVAEHAARERDRMAVRRRRSGTRRAARRPRPASSVAHRLRGHARLVAEHQHHHVAAWVHGGERRGDRGRAALPVGVVDHHLGAGEVHARADVGGRAADGDDRLVERARAGGAHHVAQQRALAVGEQLLGTAEALRAAGAQHEPGDERISPRRHAGGPARTGPCSPRSRSRRSRPRAAAEGVPATAATVMPQIGSTAVIAAARPRAAAPRPPSARIDSAISAGVRAPMSMPAGTSIRSSSSAGTPSPRSSPITPSPRLALATRPT